MKKKICITTKQGLFGRKPVNFEDLGKIKGRTNIIDGKEFVEYGICGVCNKRLRVGYKEGIYFHWCKNCGKPYKI